MTSFPSRRHHKEKRKQGLTLATLNVRGALLPKFKDVLLLLNEFNVDFWPCRRRASASTP